ncbi:MAG: hypothetical protein OEU92_15630 [Alphaproteobacteria bacterium]|nr:hypothetical protein [Alphaproteobacteria bacterium]
MKTLRIARRNVLSDRNNRTPGVMNGGTHEIRRCYDGCHEPLRHGDVTGS